MYFVEPGKTHKTRVTLTAGKSGDSWLANAVQNRFVLRLGMESGFEACVAIARGLKNNKSPRCWSNNVR